MIKNNKFVRIIMYTFACLGVLVVVSIAFDKEYLTSKFYRDLLLSLLIAINTVFVLPIVARFFEKTK